MKNIAALLFALCLAATMLLGTGALADDRAEMLINAAVSQLGYAASRGGYTKYGEWGGKAYGEWCSEFVSWCVNFADEHYGTAMLDSVYPMQTTCEHGAQWFKDQGRYVAVNGGILGKEEQFYLADGVSVKERPYIPQRGDLIYIEWYKYNRLDHVGIVEFVTQDEDGTYYVHTIEGNNHILGPEPTVVARYVYRLDDPSIRGYGVLQEGLVGTELAMGAEGEAVVNLQKNLKTLGFYDGDCAGKLGKGTVTAIKKYQKARGLTESGTADQATMVSISGEIAKREAEAEDKARQKAEREARENLEATKAAIAADWFGEFDPYDEEAAWARLMQDITVLDVDQKERIYLSDGPNGRRKTNDEHRGFFFGASVGVKVLDEQDGWSKIQAYNDYDELEEGWVRPGRLKTVTPNPTWGMIIDKRTQRLYLYKEGKLLTELLISTGTTKGQNEDFCETASGDFLLISATGGFWSGNLWCDQAIRFNGGDLLHMVPAVYYGDIVGGTPDDTGDYRICESALGSRASHGCVRVQREKNADGYNHQWIWNNLRSEKNIKIIVWDDDGRRLPETAGNTPMYYNPDGGEMFHADQYCPGVKSRYLPLTKTTYAALESYPFTKLTPCNACAAPQRPEVVRSWNAVIDQAYEELGMTP
ncbi:MAG: peptidoglycan-binding protein [Clostridia bacterium]|nr:peptidoglycan-binding protein [Clostridia bacterium]